MQDELDYDDNPSSIKCYIDVRTNQYYIGSGPSILTVMVFRYLYWDEEYASYLEEGQTAQDLIEEDRQSFEITFDGAFSSREHILFLGPDFDLSSEAWRILGIWDVQRREDNAVIAVHPHRDLWRGLRPDYYRTHRSALEMELPAFTQTLTVANRERITEYGGRIGADEGLPMLVDDVHELRDYYVEVGAYDHPDGPPVQPPPP